VRIVGGRWAGRELTSPGGRVRPTAEALRASLLDALEPELAGARVLDLFAGTGALGLEAVSRGARSADFVENEAAALHSLKANVARLRLGSRGRIFKRDAIPFVERLPALAYDVALCDPPYGSAKLDRIVERWLAVPFSRILAMEHAPDHRLRLRGRRIRAGDFVATIARAPEPALPADRDAVRPPGS
jgi:16S rRNA (guanine966-N2)-methyltransferase